MNEQFTYGGITEYWLDVFCVQVDAEDKATIRLYDAEHYGSKVLTKSDLEQLIATLQEFHNWMTD